MFPAGAARPPAKLVGLIAAVTIVPLVTLFWLGWRLLEQDRLLERQQIQQRVERGADLAVAALQRAIADTERQAVAAPQLLPDDAVAVRFSDTGIEALPRGRVAYVPRTTPLAEAPAATYAAAEELEFRRKDSQRAMLAYRALSTSADAPVRVGALLRLARVQQNAGQLPDALDTYARLLDVDEVAMNAVPAALIARYGRCRLLERLGRLSELRAEAAALATALSEGRWLLTGPVYAIYTADAARWSQATRDAPSRSETLAEAVVAASERALQAGVDGGAVAGPEILRVNGEPFVVLWQRSEGAATAFVAGTRFVASQWVPAIDPVSAATKVTVRLHDSGPPSPSRDDRSNVVTTTRTAAASVLPWTIVATSVDPPPEDHEFAVRRRLLIAGMVILVLMTTLASYVVVRAVGRELAVVRLQSDFVAAVSHEFRTPLTSLRQFTDMLRDHPELPDDRRRTAYDAQARATERLMRLVESLLDFGRMEAGAREYRFAMHDCGALVTNVVEDFTSEAGLTGRPIRVEAGGAVDARVDPEALGRAVRNLLDNAVKYSPGRPSIDVTVTLRGSEVVITVTDRGIGIPAAELASVFTKFTRGEEARTRGIKGTGIGLAMVDEIVRAHHGRVEVVSEPGGGSAFAIVLPAGRAAEAAAPAEMGDRVRA